MVYILQPCMSDRLKSCRKEGPTSVQISVEPGFKDLFPLVVSVLIVVWDRKWYEAYNC